MATKTSEMDAWYREAITARHSAWRTKYPLVANHEDLIANAAERTRTKLDGQERSRGEFFRHFYEVLEGLSKDAVRRAEVRARAAKVEAIADSERLAGEISAHTKSTPEESEDPARTADERAFADRLQGALAGFLDSVRQRVEWAPADPAPNEDLTKRARKLTLSEPETRLLERVHFLVEHGIAILIAEYGQHRCRGFQLPERDVFLEGMAPFIRPFAWNPKDHKPQTLRALADRIAKTRGRPRTDAIQHALRNSKISKRKRANLESLQRELDERTPLALRDGVLTDFSNRIAAEALRLCGFKKSIVNSALVCHRTRNSPTQEQRHEQLRFAQLLIRHFRKPGNRSEK